jgi:heme ABC exporter ATP-binding subunit CcmA
LKEGIVLENVKKSFGTFKAIRDISMRIENNTAVAMLGPNGAGKTTLLRLISGIMKPTSGKVTVFGFEPWKFNRQLKMMIGMVSHNPFLYNDLTAYENLHFYGRIYDVENLNNRIDELLTKMGLEKRKNTPVKSFSRGMKQRLSIARALLNNPELLILDEPTSGLDIVGRRELLEYLNEYRDKRTVLLATHSLEEIEICDKVAIISSGQIVHFSDVDDEVERIYMEIVGRG